MFEDEINSLSEPYLTANGGEPYPLYPNEAGMALINLWRKEWRSNEIVQVSSSSSAWNSIRRNLFNGEYTINVRSGKSGELIESRNISISNKNCIQMKQQDFGLIWPQSFIDTVSIAQTTFLLEDFESSKFFSLIGEDTNWFFPIGYSKSSMWKVV